MEDTVVAEHASTQQPARSGETIERHECLELLAGQVVGRLAVVSGGAPLVFPVNYLFDGEAVVFRTGQGTKLTAGPRAPGCFEIDEFDRATRTGWSVLAVGRLEEVTRYDTERWCQVHGLALDPWAAGEKGHWMRLVPYRITGRRVGRRP